MNINKQDLLDSHKLQLYEKELEQISTLLHEDIAQKMYAVFNHLQYIEHHISDRQIRTTNKEMINLTKSTIEELRFLSQDVLPFCQKGISGALETFLINYSKKNDITVQIHSYGEKKSVQQTIEPIFYRLFKDLLNKLTEIFSIVRMEVTIFFEAEFHISINVETDIQTNEQHERFLTFLQASEEKLNLVGGVMSLTRNDEKNSQLNISIPNKR